MNLCRVCTEHRDEDLVPIFSKLDDVLIANIISDCASIQILEGDGLPTNICQICIEEVKSTSAFVRKCRESDKKLRKLFETEEENMPVIFPMIMMDMHSASVSKFEPEEIEMEPQMEPELKKELKTEVSEEDFSSDDEEEDPSFKVQLKNNQKSKRRKKSKKQETDSDSESDSASASSDDVKVPKKRGRQSKEYDVSTLHESIALEYTKGVLCCLCLKEFENSNLMKEHAAKAHSESTKKYINKDKTHVCQVCNRRFAEARLLDDHHNVYSQLKRIFKCKKCNRNFKERRYANGHAKNHPKPRPESTFMKEKEALLGFICCGGACDAIFKTKEELIAHSIEHEVNKMVTEVEKLARPFECCYCFRRFLTTKAVKLHQRRKYRQPKYQCILCGLQLKSALLLEVHERKHKGIRPFACEKCQKRFYSAEILKTHMAVHDPVKKYVCEECGWAFNSKPNLRIHSVVHSDVKMFKCHICPKEFKVKLSLQYHLRTHTGEKPHKCRHCDKAFADPANMRHHEWSHTGYKPYKCTFCERTFLRKKQLEDHEASHRMR